MALLGKAKLNSIKRIIFRTLINSCTSYDQFVLINNVFIKDLNLFKKQGYRIVWSVKKIQKAKAQKLLRKIKEN